MRFVRRGLRKKVPLLCICESRAGILTVDFRRMKFVTMTGACNCGSRSAGKRYLAETTITRKVPDLASGSSFLPGTSAGQTRSAVEEKIRPVLASNAVVLA